jgi:hypothetical protein
MEESGFALGARVRMGDTGLEATCKSTYPQQIRMVEPDRGAGAGPRTPGERELPRGP